MPLSPADLEKVVSRGAPVLMIDTCSLLDIIREPTRQDSKVSNVIAANKMLSAAEANEMFVLIAEQVNFELQENVAGVEKTANDAMQGHILKAKHVDLVAAEFGITGAMDTSHLVDYVVRARAVLSRWESVSIILPDGPDVSRRAMHRVRHGIAPSRKGKESSKDCFVIESYIETAAQLNAAAFTAPMVFGSSNTNEYFDSISKQVRSPLNDDLTKHRLYYAGTHNLMNHLLFS